MTGRILLVTFQQALRSIVLTLFPIAFLALIGWASAGSASGNTSDPIRAAIWLWLGTHLVPFKLSLAPAFVQTSFSYLPIAAVLLPFFALRSGFKRCVQFLGNERASRSFLTLWYVLIASSAALLVQSESVKPVIYLVPIYVGSIALLSTVNYSSPYFDKFKLLWFSLVALTGFALAIFAFSLISHFKTVNDLAIVIQPGWVGGVYLLILQILYLPNIAISALSYILGIGFSVGLNTQLDPLTFNLRSLPAIPVLGGLPNGKISWLLGGLLLLVAIVLINQVSIIRDFFDAKSRRFELIKGTFPIAVALAIIGYLSQGGLITNEMSPIGPVWWKLPILLILVQLSMILIGIEVPQLVKKFRGRN